MANGIKFDKTSYAPGEKITATVTDDRRIQKRSDLFATVFGTLTSEHTIRADGKLVTDLPAPAADVEWTLVSDDGVTAVFTTTAA